MDDCNDKPARQFTIQSRRDLLKSAGLVGIAAAGSGAAASTAEAAQSATLAGAGPREALETLTALESQTLEAIVDRILPSDENGPGAKEARAAHYIDRSLAADHAANRDEYAIGLTVLNESALKTEGKPFHLLAADLQDALLAKVSTDEIEGFMPSGAAFFRMVRDHMIEGVFSDPYYGGNRNFVGWDLLGYPGIRLGATEREVELGVALEPTHQSAYDHVTFTKAGNGGR